MVLVLFCGVLDRPQATVQDDIEDAGGSQATGRGQKPPGLFRDAARRPSDNRLRVDRTVFPTNAIQFCLSIKVLFKLPLRQTTGMVASLLKLAGLDWAVPDYTTLCRRQKTLAVQIPYRRADGPLSLLVDSTGI